MADNQSNAGTKPRQGNRRSNNNRNHNGNRNNNNNRRRPRRNNYRRPKQKPLTFWQKILKFLGLYDPKKANKPQNKNNNKDGNNQPKKNRASKEKKEKDFKPKNADELATTRLYVGNLSYEATEFELEDLFKGIGNVKSVEVIYNKHTHRSKGYAFISMGTIDDAKRAIEVLHNQPFMGRNLNISGAKERPESNSNSED